MIGEMTYSSWIAQKSTTAQALGGGCCGGSYAEGAIILCVAISAMAAVWWPGKEIDKKRFIEIITKFRTSEFDPTMVSVSLLAEKSDVWRQKLQISNKHWYLTGKDDETDTCVLNLCPGSLKKYVREYSYASLLYCQIRCNFVHKYRIGERAVEGDQVRSVFNVNDSEISYVNPFDNGNLPPKRLIHFPLEWIGGLAANIARELDAECVQQNKQIFEDLALTRPDPWWIDGA
jgi:hypothetical protein